jgi:mono/diheme cytochrome c family protein
MMLGAPAAVRASVDGPALYRHWCARCHGERGDGRGPAAAALALNGRPPRDFTTGRFRWTSVPSGTAPAATDLVRTVTRGLPETSMPSFADLLSAEEVAALVTVVRGFDATPDAPGAPIDLGPEPPGDAASLARGAKAYQDLGCPVCHGQGGRGDGIAAAQLRASDGSVLAPADLTRPWAFRGGARAGDVAMRLAAGIAGTPMPSYLDIASIAELWDVAHYVGSLASAPSLEVAALARARAPLGAGEAPAVRGAYLVKSGTCLLCHARMHDDGSYVEGSFAAGGMRVEITHGPTLYTRNLTPDPATGLGKWTPADLRRALRHGRTPDGRGLNALDMPWTVLAGLEDDDIDAVHAYLASLPAVHNPLPPPAAPSLASGVGGKLATWAAGGQIAGRYLPGEPRSRNAGRATQGWPAAEARVAVVCLAVLAAYLGLRRSRSRLEGALVVALLVAAPLVYAWPPLAWMPAELVRATGPWAPLGAVLGLPPIRPVPQATRAADDATRVLAARGRYVATLGTCSLCHTAGPDPLRPWRPVADLAGGMRVEWRVFGTVYSRNLTPDRETGLGEWSDAEIRRAVTSGISRDGRLLHWQAMPWDHFSNLKLEDLYALMVYLRHVPAIRSEVPPASPPAASDAPGDTFFFGYTGTLGG